MFKLRTGIAIISFALFAALCAAQSSRPRSRKKVPKPEDVYKLTVDPKSPGDPGSIGLIKKLSRKYATSQPYAFAGDLEVARQIGEDPKIMLAKAKIKLTASGSKYELRVENKENTPGGTFDLISDGTKKWFWSPGPKQYIVRDVKPMLAADSAVRAIENGLDPEPRDVVGEFALELMPTLAGLATSTQISFLRGSVLTVISKKDEGGRQTLMYMTLNSETLAISKLTMIKAFFAKGEKMLVRFDLNFQKFVSGEADAEARFKFDPPDEAQLVDALPTDIHPEDPVSQPEKKQEAKPEPQSPPTGVR